MNQREWNEEMLDIVKKVNDELKKSNKRIKYLEDNLKGSINDQKE